MAKRPMPAAPPEVTDAVPASSASEPAKERKREICLYCGSEMLVSSTRGLYRHLKCPSCGATRKVARQDVVGRLQSPARPAANPPPRADL